MNSPILVTGASGHTGRRLVEALLERGEKVRIFTREPARMPIELRKQVEVFRGNLDNVDDVLEGMAGCRAVFALTHIKFADRILQGMKATGVKRGIFTSSTRRFTKFPEITANQVIEGEGLVESSGVDFTIIRPSMIYGGRQDRNLEILMETLQKFPVFFLPGGGSMKWQPVFTWDVVAALLAAFDRPETIGKSITVAGPEAVTYKEMISTMVREAKLKRLLIPVPLGVVRGAVRIYGKMSKSPRVTLDQIQRMEEDKVFDIAEARRELGFSPVSFREGIRRKLDKTA